MKKKKKNRLKDLTGKINERIMNSKKKSMEDREEQKETNIHQNSPNQDHYKKQYRGKKWKPNPKRGSWKQKNGI